MGMQYMERLKHAYALNVRFGTFRRRRVSLSPLSYALRQSYTPG